MGIRNQCSLCSLTLSSKLHTFQVTPGYSWEITVAQDIKMGQVWCAKQLTWANFSDDLKLHQTVNYPICIP